MTTEIKARATDKGDLLSLVAIPGLVPDDDGNNERAGYLLGADFNLAVVKGLVPGHSSLHKFGRNPDIDTASGFEVIWNGGGSYTGFDATGAEIVTVSGGANDVATTGTGAWTVQIWGLDANYAEQTEVISLNGVTLVDSVNSYIRMHRMRVTTAGSLGWNDAAITCAQKVTTAVVFAVLPAQYNSTMIAAYTIPAGKTGYITNWFAGLSGRNNADCQVRLRKRPFGAAFQVTEEISVKGTSTSIFTRNYATPKGPLSEKADIFIESDTDTNNTGVAAGWDMILVEDGY